MEPTGPQTPPPYHQGLYVQQPEHRRPSRGWRVVRWLLVIGLVAVCAMSLFFNLVVSKAMSQGVGDDGVIEQHVSGPSSFTAGAKIAVVSIQGVILGDDNSGSVEWITKQLKHAREDSKVKAVILDVDSPGGGITASDIVYRHVQELQAPPYNKKVVVLMGDVAASGAYYASVAADEIIAHPTSVTGSIGVIISSFNIEGLLEKVGVKSVVYKSAPQKDIMSLYRSATPEEAAILQGVTDEMFERFKGIVMKGRKLTQQEVDAVTTGAIFTASRARELKLIDAVGYFDDAVASAGKGIPTEAAVVRYEREPTFMEHLLGVRQQAAAPALDKSLARLAETRAPGFYYLWPGP